MEERCYSCWTISQGTWSTTHPKMSNYAFYLPIWRLCCSHWMVGLFALQGLFQMSVYRRIHVYECRDWHPTFKNRDLQYERAYHYVSLQNRGVVPMSPEKLFQIDQLHAMRWIKTAWSRVFANTIVHGWNATLLQGPDPASDALATESKALEESIRNHIT